MAGSEGAMLDPKEKPTAKTPNPEIDKGPDGTGEPIADDGSPDEED